MNIDKIIWKTLESYFLSNPYGLVQHHINSYDNFFTNEIFQIVKGKNPIKISKNFDETLDDFKFNCELYIGGIDGNQLYFGKPIIYDENNTHYMYPNEARLRNMTYAFTIHYDVLIKYKFINDDNTITENELSIPKILLGRFPIMLHSNKCILQNTNRQLRYNMGECKNDLGGYFIIDGKEKVIIPQEQFASNLVCYKTNKDDDKYSHSAIIRMMSEDASKPVRTMKIHIVRDTDSLYMNNIVVDIPNVRQPIPLFILMRALGIISDKDIIKYCILDINNKEMIEHFRASVYDAGTIFSQETAIKYISQFLKFKNIHYTYHILCDYLLPQVGEMNFKNKAYFIGNMVFNLLKLKLKLISDTDRDNFKYKRVELPGNLIYDLFKEYYNLLQKEIQGHIENDLYYHYTNTETNYLNVTELQLVSEVFSSEFIKDDKKDEKKKHKLGYNEIFKNKIVDNGFKKSYKGRWGATPLTTRLGIIQDLNRLSFNSFISHLRKINLPLDESAKVVGPRLCHSSQYGIIDPMDTPDGGNCGLHKHLAITSYITNGYSYKLLFEWLRENINVRLLEECIPENIINKTKIFINGTWIGIVNQLVSTVNFLKFARRIALIPIYTSISCDYINNSIEIFTDGGRITRPLFYIDETKELSINSDLFKKSIGKTEHIDWFNIVSGFNNKKNKIILRNNSFYEMNELYNDSIDTLNKNKSVIEYIDSSEMNTLLVSSSIDKIKYNNKYTHLEIHPSCMFGYMGNLVIYPETNPLPRNLFSCGQSKQAVSLYHTNYVNRVDKTGIVLNYGQTPLVKTRYLDYFNKEENVYGENTIVAIGCYGGYNVEDAILINKGSVDRGLFRTTYYSVYETREESSLVKGNTVNSKITNVEKLDVDRKKTDYDYSYLNDNGLVKENTKLDEKIIVIGKVTVDAENVNKYFDSSVKTKRGQLGYVDKSFITDDEEGFRLAKVKIRDERIPSIGDKMASRAGQKGTIGLVIPEEDMPFTSDGIKPDLIINPHALPSRMTIGQLVECITGKACCYYGNFGNCTSFQNVDQIDLFGKLLSKAGYESHGNEILYNGYTGEQLETSIFIGPTYYMRLKHMVKDKINYRAKGPKTGLTKQAVQGRANDGGLRIGEMERDGVIGHGSSYFLKESMMKRGDDYKIAVCNKTGTFAAYNKSKNILLSLFTDGARFKRNGDDFKLENITKYGRSFSLVEIPYSLKLLIQELQTMNIQTRLITEDNIEQLENMSYSNNYKISTRDIMSEEIDEIKQLLQHYSFVDQKNGKQRENIREEFETPDIYFGNDDDEYDLHEFDEPEEKIHTPDTPDYAPDSPGYSPDGPGYSPISPGNNQDTDFTPKEQPIMDETFKKIYIKKYPKSHFGEQEAAYRKFLDTGDIIPHEQISEEDVKFGPSSDDFERWSSTEMNGGKIELNIGNGENREKDDNLEKISEKNITFEGGSILQPVKIVNKEEIKKKSLLKKEINELKGENAEYEGDDEDNYDSNDSSSSSNEKKINFSLK